MRLKRLKFRLKRIEQEQGNQGIALLLPEEGRILICLLTMSLLFLFRIQLRSTLLLHPANSIECNLPSTQSWILGDLPYLLLESQEELQVHSPLNEPYLRAHLFYLPRNQLLLLSFETSLFE